MPSARLLRQVLVPILIVSSALAGCSDDDEDNPVNPTPSTQLTGPFAGAGDGGLMTLTIPLVAADLAPVRPAGAVVAHDVEALATLSLDSGGGPVNLSGTYNEESDSLNLTGQGYTVVGQYGPAEPFIAGSFTGPLGNGLFSCAIGGRGAIAVYCGEHVNSAQTSTGRWHIAISGTTAFGFAVIDSETIYYEGTVTGTGGVRSIVVRQDLGNGVELLVDGTLNTANDDVWGEWVLETNDMLDDHGTWDGALCLSGLTGPN